MEEWCGVGVHLRKAAQFEHSAVFFVLASLPSSCQYITEDDVSGDDYLKLLASDPDRCKAHAMEISESIERLNTTDYSRQQLNAVILSTFNIRIDVQLYCVSSTNVKPDTIESQC